VYQAFAVKVHQTGRDVLQEFPAHLRRQVAQAVLPDLCMEIAIQKLHLDEPDALAEGSYHQ
jgi:hypothetical protein